ncbi:unnamed protein product [Schistocephalus solidus]|uniref:Uncharacterized protein n=1 Tax=Schistocephalus solidus TaxID=70667 RepID=A0A183TJB5_SCHSO|nr:unnamed protein product [Schistocephalus solidus]
MASDTIVLDVQTTSDWPPLHALFLITHTNVSAAVTATITSLRLVSGGNNRDAPSTADAGTAPPPPPPLPPPPQPSTVVIWSRSPPVLTFIAHSFTIFGHLRILDSKIYCNADTPIDTPIPYSPTTQSAPFKF